MKKLKNLITHMRQASGVRSIPAQLLDIILHKLILCVSAADYYHFEFYRPGKTWQQKSRYVALGGSIYWPFENNEFRYGTALTDKYVQKHLLIGFDLPTPRLMATVGPGRDIQDDTQWRDFLNTVQQPIMLKPVSSAGGDGILAVSRRGERFFAGTASQTPEQLWEHMQSKSYQGFLIEERVSNTGVLARLNPTSLNTFRVVTIKTNDGVWHVAAPAVKIGAPGAVTDNNAQGGIQINLDESGRPRHTFDFATRQSITHHPETGIDLMNLELEGYRDVIDLALRASRCFGFLGTVGWDIAWTDQGAMIIEGNIVWGCSSLQRGGPGMITDTLAAGLKRHHVFGRWDKSRLYPGYNRRPFWS